MDKAIGCLLILSLTFFIIYPYIVSFITSTKKQLFPPPKKITWKDKYKDRRINLSKTQQRIIHNIDNYCEIREIFSLSKQEMKAEIRYLYPGLYDSIIDNIIKEYHPNRDVLMQNIQKERLLIKSLSWQEFEEYIAKLFMDNGYVATVTPPRWDKGKDIIAEKDGITYFIECKHYSSEVIGRPYLQKLAGAALPYNVTNIIFVTTSTYHSNAYEYQRALNSSGIIHLTLMDLDDIIEMKFPE